MVRGEILAKVKRSGKKRSEINEIINDYVISAKYRKILRMKLLDGETYEKVAEVMRPQMSPRQIKRIVSDFVDEHF